MSAIGQPFRLGYRPALDGLRAVAVVAVMLHHSGLLPGGWLGVDVFFTLSGFLITTLLLEEYDRAGTVSFRHFYLRRARRLIPALLTMIAVWGTAALVWCPPEQFRLRLLFLALVLFYVGNLGIIAGLGVHQFGHTWSLAIEEQFYLFWPPALLLLLQRVRNRVAVLSIVAIGAVASAAWRGLLVREHTHVVRVFVGLDTHADSILIGCALAMLLAWRNPLRRWLDGSWGRWMAAAAGLALCGLFAAARFPEHFFQFASTLTAVVAALLIAALLTHRGAVAKLLETRPLVGLGRISYGLYLWHFPVFFALGVVFGPPGLNPASIALAWIATFAASAVSFKLVEQPILRRGRTAGPDRDTRMATPIPQIPARAARSI